MIKRTYLFMILIISMSPLIFCQETFFLEYPEQPAQKVHYYGYINEDLPVLMELNINDEEITGRYFYLSWGGKLSLTGKKISDDQVLLTEKDSEGNTTGYFNGAFEGRSFSGRWTDHKNTFPFELDMMASAARYSINYGQFYNAEYRYPFLFNLYDINSELMDEISFMADNFMALCLEYYEEDQYSFLGWVTETDYEIVFYNKYILSIAFNTCEYTGGAHSNYFTYGKNYISSPIGLVETSLSGLFRPNTDYMKVLNSELLADLKEQGASDVVEKRKTIFNYDELQNWSFSPRGLIFYFAPYCIGCFAEGSYTALVEYSKLENILDEKIMIKLAAFD